MLKTLCKVLKTALILLVFNFSTAENHLNKPILSIVFNIFNIVLNIFIV